LLCVTFPITDASTISMRTTIHIREASGSVLVAFTAAVLVLGAVTASAPVADVAAAVRLGTGGWIAPDLLAAALLMAVAVGGVVILGGGMRAADVGLRGRGMAAGLLTLLGVGGVFAAALLAGLAGPDGVRLYPGLDAWGAAGIAGFVLGALAMAAFTETAFRGFLFPQLYLKLRGTGTTAGPALWSAAALSALAAAALYAPALAFTHGKAGGSLALHLAGFAVSGMFLCLFYLRTGNLYVVIAGHALITVASQGFAVTGRTAGLMTMLGVVFVAVWPLLIRRPLRDPLAAIERIAAERAPAPGAAARA
jgi:membrane protease YdiL (CAAX protease family)